MPEKKIQKSLIASGDRIPSGIYGLDELIEGGFLKGRNILISGGAGTGKTIFAMQYTYNSIVKNNEKCVYVTLDERPEILRQDMSRFGWDIEKLEEQGKLAIIDVSAAKVGVTSDEKYALPTIGIDVDRLLTRVMQVVDEIGATRVVFDSVSGFGFHVEDEREMRKTILKINYLLGRAGVSSLMTSEVNEESGTNNIGMMSRFGVEEYIADGVIVLHYLGIGTESNRSLFIRKMRGTNHVEDILPMQITQKGIIVKRPEEAYKV